MKLEIKKIDTKLLKTTLNKKKKIGGYEKINDRVDYCCRICDI